MKTVMEHQNLSNNQIISIYNNMALHFGWDFINSSYHLLQSR